MEQRLKGCLLSYMFQNTPDLLMALQGDQNVGEYLEQKIILIGPLMDRMIEEEAQPYYIEKECLRVLTEDLKPSKFHFVRALLKKEFPHYYHRLQAAGTLTLEVTNIITTSFDLFDTFEFTEKSKEDTAFIYAMRNGIVSYFKKYSATSI